jgi:hypothetical protein
VGITLAQHRAIEIAAKGIIEARVLYKTSSLADLYDPLTMPSELIKAHRDLDRAVDQAYVNSGWKRNWRTDAERVAFLFDLYVKLTANKATKQGG